MVCMFAYILIYCLCVSVYVLEYIMQCVCVKVCVCNLMTTFSVTFYVHVFRGLENVLRSLSSENMNSLSSTMYLLPVPLH